MFFKRWKSLASGPLARAFSVSVSLRLARLAIGLFLAGQLARHVGVEGFGQLSVAMATVAVLLAAAGDQAFPKESWRLHAAGLVLECENFLKLSVYRGRKRSGQTFASKGHAEEMAAWSGFLRGEGGHPLPYAVSRLSMRLTFAALQSARENRVIVLGELD